jgi:Family of unknown function (DUF5670)
MLFLGVLFLGLWLAGLVTSYTMGGFIHALLVLAIIALLSNLIRGGNSRRLAELTASVEQSGLNQSS